MVARRTERIITSPNFIANLAVEPKGIFERGEGTVRWTINNILKSVDGLIDDGWVAETDDDAVAIMTAMEEALIRVRSETVDREVLEKSFAKTVRDLVSAKITTPFTSDNT